MAGEHLPAPAASPAAHRAPLTIGHWTLGAAFVTLGLSHFSWPELHVSSPLLTPGTLLSERYRVGEELGRGVFQGTDEESQAPLVLVEVTAEQAAHIRPLRGLEHAHIARLWEVVELADGRAVLVGEAVEGKLLGEHVREQSASLAPSVDGVRLVLRLADALSHGHQLGGAHGSVTPLTVVAEPQDRSGPVLAWRGWQSAATEEELGPSEARDAHDVTRLLYFVLTGEEAPPQGVVSADELERAGIVDGPLQQALLGGLNPDPSFRTPSLKLIKRELARWFVEHASEEALPSGPRSTEPPPLPAEALSVRPLQAAPAPAVLPARVSIRPRARSKRVLSLWFAAALVVGLLSAWVMSINKAPEEPLAAAPPPAPLPVEQGPAAIDLGEVPVMGEEQAVLGDKAASCVAGYLPKGAFGRAPELEWLCKERDPRQGARKLRVAVVQGAPARGAPTEAMRLMGTLGWYDMPAFAVIRAGCCPEPGALELPAPSTRCQSMALALDELGRAVVSAQELEALLARYDEAVRCELAAGRAAEFDHAPRIDGGEASAFRRLVQGVAQP